MSSAETEPGVADPAAGDPAAFASVVRTERTYEGKQGLTYGEGVFADNVGASHICMHLLQIPPGGRAKAHLHENHETAIYLISGRTRVFHGPGLTETTEMVAGDFMYIPANCPHLPTNPSATEKAVAVLARTDPNEQESVVLLPELEAAVADSR